MIIMLLVVTAGACNSNKTGCPINEQATVTADKNGKLPTKGGKSGLFPKNMTKKKKKAKTKKKKTEE